MKPQDIDEIIGPNGYYYSSYPVTQAIPPSIPPKTSLLKYMIIDLKKFMYMPIWGNGAGVGVSGAGGPIYAANNLLRILTNGPHYSGAHAKRIYGDIKGYRKNNINFASSYIVHEGERQPPRVDDRHSTGFDDPNRKILPYGVSRIYTIEPPPPATPVNPATAKVYMIGGALILDPSNGLTTKSVTASTYHSQLVAHNTAGWQSSLAPLSHSALRGRWCIAALDDRYIIIAAVSEGIKNKPLPGQTRKQHHGLSIYRFANEVESLGNRIKGKSVKWAVTYDASQQYGMYSSDSAFLDPVVRARDSAVTYSYLSVFRRSNGYIEKIDSVPVPRTTIDPIDREVKLSGSKSEFEVDVFVSALQRNVPDNIEIKVIPDKGFTATPRKWSKSQITNLSGTRLKAKVKVDLSKAKDKNRILQFRGEQTVSGSKVTLFEHNVRLKVTRDIQYAFVIDNSDSMANSDPGDNRLTALKTFSARYFNSPEHYAGLVSFSSSAKTETNFVRSQAQFNNAVDGISPPSGGTNFNAALSVVSRMYTGTAPMKERRVFFFTDGKHNSGNFEHNWITRLKNKGVVVDVVLLGADIDDTIPVQIAKGTGGKLHRLLKSSDIHNIVNDMLDTILEEQVADTVDIKLSPTKTVRYKVNIRSLSNSVVQVTWPVTEPPPVLELQNKLGATVGPSETGTGFAIFRGVPLLGKALSKKRNEEWTLIARANPSATSTIDLHVVSSESVGHLPHIEMLIPSIPSISGVDSALLPEVHIFENGMPVSSQDRLTPVGTVNVSLSVISSNGSTKTTQLVNKNTGDSEFVLPKELYLRNEGVYQLKFVANGTDSSGLEYKRSKIISVRVTSGYDVKYGAWPGSTVRIGSKQSFNTSVKFRLGTPQPSRVRLMGNWVGDESNSFTLIEFKWNKNAAGYSVWKGVLRVPQVPGTMNVYWLLEGDSVTTVHPSPNSNKKLRTEVLPAITTEYLPAMVLDNSNRLSSAFRIARDCSASLLASAYLLKSKLHPKKHLPSRVSLFSTSPSKQLVPWTKSLSPIQKIFPLSNGTSANYNSALNELVSKYRAMPTIGKQKTVTLFFGTSHSGEAIDESLIGELLDLEIRVNCTVLSSVAKKSKRILDEISRNTLGKYREINQPSDVLVDFSSRFADEFDGDEVDSVNFQLAEKGQSKVFQCDFDDSKVSTIMLYSNGLQDSNYTVSLVQPDGTVIDSGNVANFRHVQMNKYKNQVAIVIDSPSTFGSSWSLRVSRPANHSSAATFTLVVQGEVEELVPSTGKDQLWRVCAAANPVGYITQAKLVRHDLKTGHIVASSSSFKMYSSASKCIPFSFGTGSYVEIDKANGRLFVAESRQPIPITNSHLLQIGINGNLNKRSKFPLPSPFFSYDSRNNILWCAQYKRGSHYGLIKLNPDTLQHEVVLNRVSSIWSMKIDPRSRQLYFMIKGPINGKKVAASLYRVGPKNAPVLVTDKVQDGAIIASITREGHARVLTRQSDRKYYFIVYDKNGNELSRVRFVYPGLLFSEWDENNKLFYYSLGAPTGPYCGTEYLEARRPDMSSVFKLRAKDVGIKLFHSFALSKKAGELWVTGIVRVNNKDKFFFGKASACGVDIIELSDYGSCFVSSV